MISVCLYPGVRSKILGYSNIISSLYNKSKNKISKTDQIKVTLM